MIPRFDLVVFLFVPTGLRLARLRQRELAQFGAEALEPGGKMHENCTAFLEWAADYDEGDLDMRSLALHEAWVAELPCPVERLEGEMTVAYQLERILGPAGEPAP